MKDKFRYSRIDTSKGEIRLLKIQPGRTLDDSIKCSLQVVSLTPDLDFDALSYAWGDLEKIHPIELNGDEICIAENLGVALPRLRFYYADTLRWIWIDALCINQDDVQERGEQVQLMGKIFGSAVRVISWLGDYPGPSSIPSIFSVENDETVREIFSAITAFPPTPLWDTGKLTFERRRIFKANARALAGAISPEKIGYLKDILARPYFQRLWIVQEIALAREIIVLLGSTVIGWYDMYLASSFIADPFRLEDHCGRPAYLYLIRHLYQDPEKSRIELLRDGWRNMDILNLKKNFQDFQVSDQRDRIVALLGIASDQGTIQFQPDYSMPEEDFFLHFCHTYIRANGFTHESLVLVKDCFPELSRTIEEEFCWNNSGGLTACTG